MAGGMTGSLDLPAILGAAAIGLGLSIGLGLIMGFLALLDPGMAPLWSEDMDEEALEAEMKERVRRELNQPAMLLALLVFSVVVMMFTGFLAARWANGVSLPEAALNAGAAGALYMTVAMVMERVEKARGMTFPRWYALLTHALTLPAALAGGWLHVLSTGGM